MANGPGGDPPVDRWGRDAHRHPMRWSDDEPHGGFTDGEPWLPATPVDGGAVDAQERDPGSLLRLYRDLIALRRDLAPGLELLDAAEGVLAYRRGEHLIALNLAAGERAAPVAGELVRHTHGRTGRSPERLASGEGFVAKA
jgi:alpha-glucosidase